MEKLISIIVPVYNVSQYIDRCMTSLLNQTYRNIEIIMVDDGSLDNCGIKCDQYAAKDLRVRVMHKKKCWTGYGQKCRIGYSTGAVCNIYRF